MRLLALLPFVALLATAPARAQHAETAPLPAAPAAVAPAAPDTVAALYRLFAGRRQRRNLIAAGLGAGVVVGVAAAATIEEPHGSSGYGSLGGGAIFSGPALALVCAIPVLPLLALDFVVYADYSRRDEARAVAAFRAHQLSARLRRKLKLRYFRDGD